MFDIFPKNLAKGIVTEQGTGRVSTDENGLRLTVSPGGGYHNAQITDYRYGEYAFQWSPPITLTVTASASNPELIGTAGFGFWNHPLSPDLRRLPRLPAAVWFFFGAPPHNLRLAYNSPGHGWKAQTIDAAHIRAAALAPVALPLMLAMKLPALYRRLYPSIQKALKVSESILPSTMLATDHTYQIMWRADGCRFLVDGSPVLETPYSPGGKLGFIAWIDNQYMIATPQGHFRWGVTPLSGEQSLLIRSISVEHHP